MKKDLIVIAEIIDEYVENDEKQINYISYKDYSEKFLDNLVQQIGLIQTYRNQAVVFNFLLGSNATLCNKNLSKNEYLVKLLQTIQLIEEKYKDKCLELDIEYHTIIEEHYEKKKVMELKSNVLTICDEEVKWDDVTLNEDIKKSIKQIIDKKNLDKLQKWGMQSIAEKSRKMLFYGEPGTGKTMVSKAIATEFGKKLGIVSIPSVLGKYVGDTEKSIQQIFIDAKRNDCLILLDEADALLSKRISDSGSNSVIHNKMINQFLQEIENFDGILILTTNLVQNLDSALERRIQTKIHFPLPDTENMIRIYQSIKSEKTPWNEV